MKAPVLGADLEYALLGAVARGVVSTDVVTAEELSKNGKVVHAALTALRSASDPPFGERAIMAQAVEVLGAERDKIRPYVLKVVGTDSGREAEDILRAVRAKQSLVGVINEAGRQLARGSLDVGALTTLLQSEQQAPLTPVGKKIKDKLPARPTGIQIPLKAINDATGGVLGLWVIGGETGVGKSTFTLQLATYMGERMPVLFYDAENGEDLLVANLGDAMGRDLDRLKHATRNLYIRPTIRTLGTDLETIKPPATIVVDSAQKFGFDSSAKNRRDGIDTLLRRVESLKKRGYFVIVTSEINRAQYGQVSNAGYAESRELEFSADMAAQLKGDKDGVDVDFHITKNRHRPVRGYITRLQRENDWWFTEVSDEGQDWDEDDIEGTEAGSVPAA